ncbi:MAG: hypothetical protein MUF54_14085 [Polyangiaceae bacterium]|nr:hypothetical protein [Polyangiaceae bacterium]
MGPDTPTGKPPFHATTLVDLAAHIVLAPVKLPSELAEQIPPVFDALLLRALEKDPKNRYASAREFRAALCEFMAQQGLAGLRLGLPATPAAHARSPDPELSSVLA